MMNQKSRGGNSVAENFIKVIDLLSVKFSAFDFVGPGEARDPCGGVILG